MAIATKLDVVSDLAEAKAKSGWHFYEKRDKVEVKMKAADAVVATARVSGESLWIWWILSPNQTMLSISIVFS